MQFSDFSSPAFFANPYPLYEKIRAAGPLVPVGPSAFVTGRFEIIDTLLRDARMGKTYMQSVAARYGANATAQPVFQSLNRTLLMMNPPAHTRLRALLMRTFNAHGIGKLTAIVEATTDGLLDQLGARAEFDLVADYALPLPVRIICRLLDVPVADATALGDAASRLVAAFDLAPLDAAGLHAADEAALTLERYFSGVVAERRAQPGDDLVSAMLSVEDEGLRLSDEEVVSNALLLFIAGHETTSNMIGNMMIALFRHPQQRAALQQDLQLLPRAIAECMRYDGAVQMLVRTAFEDIALGDVSLARGSLVFMLIGSANRDPAVFTEPDTLDFARSAGTPALAFGAGIHYCLGARLAALELNVAMRSLLARFPALGPVDLEALVWHRRNNLRGVTSLRVRTSAG
ncbi:cytochrome P450 [Paraburkholderia sp. MMS20-SJTN17]|uniref:Cytochrome P450 n=1 Tax=Paraburkholderia translucens TaxID=2886945 RepID=A0ABS8KDI8_9BURK|nr:cytochrome P450 [Paraburkholderia sp. MMS20-SJTN17]MCC8402462.1 cytochrome P450 [Paraburkholderia sp. MMS20-SJTN17]